MTQDKERHERVIHTRVPETLETELKERASQMGISVSNLVRNVLANALGLVNDVVADTEQLVRSALRGSNGKDEVSVLGWQGIVLEKNAICDRCNAILRKGTRAAIGVREHGGSRAIICPRCLARLERGDGPGSEKVTR